MIIDNLHECGPLIVVEVQIDELKNALRDKLIERGVSREIKIESASRMVEDFEDLLKSLAQSNIAIYTKEDGELYRKAHGIYKKIEKECREKVKARRRMQRDSMLIAVVGLYRAILVTRDQDLYRAVECLHLQSSKEYSSILIHVDQNRKSITITSCTKTTSSCIPKFMEKHLTNYPWTGR